MSFICRMILDGFSTKQGCACAVGAQKKYEEKHRTPEVRADEETDVWV